MALNNRSSRTLSTIVIETARAIWVRPRAARQRSLHTTVVCFDSVIYRFQAKDVNRTFHIEDGGENTSGAEGLGFDSDDEAIVREIGVGTVEHGEIALIQCAI